MLLWAVVALAIPIAIRLILGISHPNDKQVFGEADVTYIGDAELLGITILILLYHRFPGRFGRFDDVRSASHPFRRDGRFDRPRPIFSAVAGCGR